MTLVGLALAVPMVGCVSTSRESTSEFCDFGEPSCDEAPIELPDEIEQASYVESVSSEALSQSLDLDTVIAQTRSRHPSMIEADRLVEKAEADIGVAGIQRNPDLVLDLDAPMNESNRATEISARVTFPIGSTNQQNRIRVARSRWLAALMKRDLIADEVEKEVTATVLRIVYLQEKLTLLTKAHQIAVDRVKQVNPRQRPGDAADNMIDYIDAAQSERNAEEERFAAESELAAAKLSLIGSMGLNASWYTGDLDGIVIDHVLASDTSDLPTIETVVAIALEDSSEIESALLEADVRHKQVQSERERAVESELGPRFQDRLGEDDDTFGVRVRTEIPSPLAQNARTRAAASEARLFDDRATAVRNQVIASVTADYQSLQRIAAQIEHDRQDPFVDEQQQLLSADDARNEMTGEQLLRIEQAINQRKLDRLELEYRFATLHAKLNLP